MGAVEPEPEVPALTKYRVTGQSKVCGVEPGKTFERAFPPKQEAQLLAGGAIEKVGGKPAATKASREAGSPDKEKEGGSKGAAT